MKNYTVCLMRFLRGTKCFVAILSTRLAGVGKMHNPLCNLYIRSTSRNLCVFPKKVHFNIKTDDGMKLEPENHEY